MVRTRFAPSPTGYLHIGGVRTALFNWLYARQHGGQFVLRIDDTDKQRNVESALQPILDGFRWLGIHWDEGPEVGGPYGPYFQSQRADRYQAAVRELLHNGSAYRDYARSDELQAQRAAAEAEKRPFTYDRRWMAETDEDAARFEAEGRQAVIRLKMPRQGVCGFRDAVRGNVEFQWNQEQDHVIQRADGTCLYHVASAVDDHDLKITHVIRAVEHLSNTPRQVFIAQSLGHAPPQYAHLPYVAEPGSSNKLSKRKINTYLRNQEFKKLCDHGTRIAELIGQATTAETFNPVLIDFYRTVGFLPDALLNYLLLLGWSLDDRAEQFTREEMIEQFSLERVTKGAASFDPRKLWAFQQRDMLALPLDEKVKMLRPYVVRAGWVNEPVPEEIDQLLRRIAVAAGDRIKVAGDVLDYDEFFCKDQELQYDEKAFNKRLRKGEAATRLKQFRDQLESVDVFDAAHTEACLRAFIEREGIKIGQVIHALRVAVTGKSVGLGMFETLAILGRDSVLARIDRALALV